MEHAAPARLGMKRVDAVERIHAPPFFPCFRARGPVVPAVLPLRADTAAHVPCGGAAPGSCDCSALAPVRHQAPGRIGRAFQRPRVFSGRRFYALSALVQLSRLRADPGSPAAGVVRRASARARPGRSAASRRCLRTGLRGCDGGGPAGRNRAAGSDAPTAPRTVGSCSAGPWSPAGVGWSRGLNAGTCRSGAMHRDPAARQRRRLRDHQVCVRTQVVTDPSPTLITLGHCGRPPPCCVELIV